MSLGKYLEAGTEEETLDTRIQQTTKEALTLFIPVLTMADYSTDLDTWGATGRTYPTGYAYEADVAPVDDFDNFLTNNTIEDIKHLISLTNDRIESDKGDTPPSSPENAHLWYDTITDTLKYYDSGALEWKKVSSKDYIEFGDNLTATTDGDGTISVKSRISRRTSL